MSLAGLQRLKPMSMTLWPIKAVSTNIPPPRPKPKHVPHPQNPVRGNCRNCGASKFKQGKCEYCGSAT